MSLEFCWVKYVQVAQEQRISDVGEVTDVIDDRVAAEAHKKIFKTCPNPECGNTEVCWYIIFFPFIGQSASYINNVTFHQFFSSTNSVHMYRMK